MSPGKSDKPSHHKPYKGPWPEEKHPSVPAQVIPPAGADNDHNVPPRGAPETPIHKSPPQWPK